MKIVKRYSQGGNRFARVLFDDGSMISVRVRGRIDSRWGPDMTNEWGERGDIEETRAALIKEMAVTKAAHDAS